MQTIEKLSVTQFEQIIERVVERKMLELFADPDSKLELRSSVRARLRRSVAATRRGERGISAKHVAKELGLKW